LGFERGNGLATDSCVSALFPHHEQQVCPSWHGIRHLAELLIPQFFANHPAPVADWQWQGWVGVRIRIVSAESTSLVVQGH